jgi:hypothetical protein
MRVPPAGMTWRSGAAAAADQAPLGTVTTSSALPAQRCQLSAASSPPPPAPASCPRR